MLEPQRDGGREGIHHARERAPCLGHHDEDLAGRSVVVHPDRDVPVVSGHGELVCDRLSLVREPLATRLRGSGDGNCRAAIFLGRREGLAALRSVPVDGDRLESRLPGGDVGVGDIGRSRRFRHVHGFRDRARDEGLHRLHHPDVSHRLDRAGPVLGLEGAVKNGEVLILEPRCSLDRLVLIHVFDDRVHRLLPVTEATKRLGHRIVHDLQHPAA